MGKSRAPEVDEEGLAAYLATPNRKLVGLGNRFAQVEKLMQSKNIPNSYIAFEGMAALLGARIEGYSDEELKAIWPESWGTDEVAVPAKLLNALSAAWVKYKEDVSGRTFGEVLGLEGGGQGKKRSVSLQITRDKDRRLANEVVIIYLSPTENGERSTRDAAISQVAERHDLTFETVDEAYKKYGQSAIFELKQQGILKGGGTS